MSVTSFHGAATSSDGAAAHKRRPLLIAHACNSAAQAERALDASTDAVEADVWLQGGRLTLRHEIKLPRVPLLFDKWYVRPERGLLSLDDLAHVVEGRAALFLDLKSKGTAMFRAVARAIERLGPSCVEVSSRHWGLLEQLREALPGLRVLYSASGHGAVGDLLGRLASGTRPPDGVSLRHTLFEPPLASRLREAGLDVYAWIVPGPARAERLAGLGVAGIIADDLHHWPTLAPVTVCAGS